MLPKLPRLRTRVSKRDGTVSYFYDHGGTPRRWEPLGKVEAAVRRRYDELEATAKAPPGSVTQMLADCLDALRGKVAEGTLANYRGYKKHLEAVFRDEPSTITQADVLRYLRTCPRMSFKNEIGFLSLAFVGWMDHGRLDFNPCFGVRIKRKTSKRLRLLTNGEIDRIVAAADPQLAVAVEISCATGLRISDVSAYRDRPRPSTARAVSAPTIRAAPRAWRATTSCAPSRSR